MWRELIHIILPQGLRELINIHVIRDVCSWLFMLHVTYAHEYSYYPWRVSWIFMLPVKCAYEYSCYPWCVLMNIHVTRDVFSWMFMLHVTVLMIIHISRNVFSWIFILQMTCSHEYSYYPTFLMNIHIFRDVSREYSYYPWRVLMNIHVTLDVCSWIFMLLVTCAHEYLCYPWRVSWIFVLPVTCTH